MFEFWDDFDIEENHAHHAEQEDDIDLNRLSVIRHSKKSMVARGEEVGAPFAAIDWNYFVDRVLITKCHPKFRDTVKEFYCRVMDDNEDLSRDYVPSIAEVSDAIDEYNMIAITEFYSSIGCPEIDIDVILGNYIQEYSCLMEDWVEIELQDIGLIYMGSSVERMYMIKERYAPQNILLEEFLR